MGSKGYLPCMVVTWIMGGEVGQIPSTVPGALPGLHKEQLLPSSSSLIINVIMVINYYRAFNTSQRWWAGLNCYQDLPWRWERAGSGDGLVNLVTFWAVRTQWGIGWDVVAFDTIFFPLDGIFKTKQNGLMSFVGFVESCLGARKGRAMHLTARMPRLGGECGPGCSRGVRRSQQQRQPHTCTGSSSAPDMLQLLRSCRNRLVLQQTPSA